jgi:hypothetical protein
MDARTAKGAAAAIAAAASHNAAAAAGSGSGTGGSSTSSAAVSSGAKGGPVSPTNGASLSTVTNGQSSSLLRRAIDVDQARAQPKQLLAGSHSPEGSSSKSPGGPASPLRSVVPSSGGSQLRAEEKGRGPAAATSDTAAAKQVPAGAAAAAGSSIDSAADADSKDTDPTAAAAGSASSRLAAAKPLTKTRVALPHHITPLAASAGSSDLEAKLRKMRADLGSDMGEAPWDEFGRPRGALGSKGLK